MDLLSLVTFSADITRGQSESYKVGLAIAALVLLFLWPLLTRLHRGLATFVLLVMTVITTANYLRWGPELTTDRVDAYDVMHYYLNAKYFEELGYLDLYPACILADHSNGGPFYKKEGKLYMAQDASGHSMKPITHALDRGRELRASHFTPERWEAFEHDFLYLQRERHPMGDRVWRQMIVDHGFNGTPAWTFLAKPIADATPVEWIKALGFLDVALLGLGFLAVGYAYGGATMLWTLLWFTLCYSLRWPTVSWAFLRYDWVAALMLAMSALRLQRPFLAGVFAGWSAVLRLFPAFWMWGPLSKGLGGLARKHVHKQLLVLALGWVVAVGVLELGATLRFGTDTTVSHMENMLDHNSSEQLSSRRIGLALGLAFGGPLEAKIPKRIEPERKKRVERQKPIRYGLALLVMLVMGFALRNARDDEAFGYGFIPIFLLTTMSYYYYIARVTLVMVHASDLKKPRNMIGMAMLLGLELLSNACETEYGGHRVFHVGYLAWGISLYILVMMGFMLWESRAETVAELPRRAKVPERQFRIGMGLIAFGTALCGTLAALDLSGWMVGVAILLGGVTLIFENIASGPQTVTT